jgi:hypothetical protein
LPVSSPFALFSLLSVLSRKLDAPI